MCVDVDDNQLVDNDDGHVNGMNNVADVVVVVVH